MPRYDCSLWKLLKDGNGINMSTRLQIMNKLLDGLLYLQSKGYSHLDVKPSNVMLNLTCGKWNGEDLVLIDFGLCSSHAKLRGYCGTPGFGSMEQFGGKPSQKSDNYSFGKTAVLILFDWQLGWNLLAEPLTDAEYKSHPMRNNVYGSMIVDLLQVGVNIFEINF